MAQLLPAWARELAGSEPNADEVEHDLTNFFIEDIVNGRLDNAGPVEDGRRLGLRLITPDSRAGYLEGHQARDLLLPSGQKATPSAFLYLSHRLVVMKEAVLDFARRHQLPAPSSWADETIAPSEQVDASSNELATECEQLLAKARATGSLEPNAQRNAVTGLIRDSLWLQACTSTEILQAAYGDRDGLRYWELYLFEPLRIYQFVDLLAVHFAAANGAPFASFAGKSVPVLDGYQRQIFDRLRGAAEIGQTWLIGDSSVLLKEKWPSTVLRNSTLIVRPREAIAWLCQNPNAHHHVPASAARVASGNTVEDTQHSVMVGNTKAYVPDWELLSSALQRVMATGIAEDQAKQDICAAISDRKIKIRCLVGKEEGIGSFGERVAGTVRNGAEIEIPPHLNPLDFDWRKSRPRKPWQRHGHTALDSSLWRLEWIELFRADVTAVLCRGAGPAKNDVQLYGGGDRERDRRTRQWRAARIERFAERQRQAREWINFAEIAEWCSKEDQSIVPNKEKRAAAFDTLASDLLAGEFEENGRSRVLYLHPATAMTRMTHELLKDAIDHNYDGEHGRSGYLPHCWIQRGMFDRWLAKHRLPQSPSRFQPQKSCRVSGATVRDETAAIRALASHLRIHSDLSRAVAAEWCRKSGYELGKRAFERVWPQAREAAGLERIGSPGRKRKSTR